MNETKSGLVVVPNRNGLVAIRIGKYMAQVNGVKYLLHDVKCHICGMIFGAGTYNETVDLHLESEHPYRL